MIFMFIFLKFFRDRAFEKECMGKILLCPLQCFWRGEVCLFQVCVNTLIGFEVVNQSNSCRFIWIKFMMQM